MFRDVPECSGMFHVPGFIDAQRSVWTFWHSKSDRAHFDFLSHETYTVVARSSFDRTRLNLTPHYYTSLSVTTWLQLSATGHTLRPVVNRSPLGKNQLSNWKTKFSRANRSTAYKNLYCRVSVAQVPEAIYWWFYCLSTFDKNFSSTEKECQLRQNLEKIHWGV